MKMMNKIFPIAALVFFTCIAQGNDSSELFHMSADSKIVLNKKIYSKIRAFGDDFKVVEFKDFEKSVNTMFKSTPNEKAMVTKGDFNGDGEIDLAVLVKKKSSKGKIQVAAFLALKKKVHRSQRYDYDVQVVDSWVQDSGKITQYLSLNKKSYMDFSKSKVSARDLIQMESLGGATIALYYYKNSSQQPSKSRLIRSPYLHVYKGQFERR